MIAKSCCLLLFFFVNSRSFPLYLLPSFLFYLHFIHTPTPTFSFLPPLAISSPITFHHPRFRKNPSGGTAGLAQFLPSLNHSVRPKSKAVESVFHPTEKPTNFPITSNKITSLCVKSLHNLFLLNRSLFFS